MNLSILDFGAVGDTLDLMVEADRLGYRRYWLGEHHSASQCANPLLLGALLAATSEGIRIGSGGVCLNYHSPYRVAEDARLIEFMLPGRFDLGVTRGLTLPPEVRDALLDGRPADTLRSHDEKLSDLHGFLTGRLPSGHPLAPQLLLKPGPPMWVLGTGPDAARWAGCHGTGFCFSLHHAPRDRNGPAILAEYRDTFVPSPEFPEPAAFVVVSLACYPANATDRHPAKPVIEGPTADCASKLAEITHRFAVDEIMILDVREGDRHAAIETCGALAAEVGLAGRPHNV